MARKAHAEEQIGFGLRQAEAGMPVPEICRKMGIRGGNVLPLEATLRPHGVAEIRGLKQLEEENRRLKQPVPHPGQGDAAGCPAPKVVKPSHRRDVVPI